MVDMSTYQTMLDWLRKMWGSQIDQLPTKEEPSEGDPVSINFNVERFSFSGTGCGEVGSLLMFLLTLPQKWEELMTDLANLQAAMDKLVTDVGAGVAEIKDLLAQIASAPDQAAIDALTAKAQDAATALEAVLPPPTPPPAPPEG